MRFRKYLSTAQKQPPAEGFLPLPVAVVPITLRKLLRYS